MKIEYQAIGIIHTPWSNREDMPIQPSGAESVSGTIEINEQYKKGLRDLDGFSHIILLYHLHLSKSFDLEVLPFLDTVSHGLFATRAPRRPNPIGLSIVELLQVEGNKLYIQGIDVVDGTPLLDVKPYVPHFDTPANVRSGWLEKTAGKARAMKSDQRFVE